MSIVYYLKVTMIWYLTLYCQKLKNFNNKSQYL